MQPVGIVGMAMLCVAGASNAQSVKDAYVQDARGVIVRSAPGEPGAGNLCWRTGSWTPALAIAECDPDISPRPARKPAATVPAQAEARATPPAFASAPVPLSTAQAAPPRRCDFSVTLGADETFAFNRALLKSAARSRLEAVVARAADCARVDQVLVTGHADRIGRAASNERLSRARAETVGSYLLSRGLPPPTVHGAGHSAPIASCAESLSRRDLIACLAPNRRVEIEIRGSAK